MRQKRRKLVFGNSVRDCMRNVTGISVYVHTLVSSFYSLPSLVSARAKASFILDLVTRTGTLEIVFILCFISLVISYS